MDPHEFPAAATGQAREGPTRVLQLLKQETAQGSRVLAHPVRALEQPPYRLVEVLQPDH